MPTAISPIFVDMRILTFLVGCLLLISCEKDITVDLGEISTKLVVEGQIENDLPPVVVLTKSISYFGNLHPDSLANLFVHDAEVYISNGIATHKLKEYAVPLIGNYYRYFYSIDSADLATAFVGELGKQYSLRILYNGEEYTSTTTIPTLSLQPDTLWVTNVPNNPDTLKRYVRAQFTDPPGLENRFRYYTKRNAEPWYPGENSVWNDQLTDGQTFSLIIEPGFDKNNPPEAEDNYFYKGDTVQIKIANIDRATYEFWETWEFAFTTIGNPFSQPNVVIGNISNGALGAFCGYGAAYYTIIAE